MNYSGCIILESLKNKDIINGFNIIETKIDKVEEKHGTPYLKVWTMYIVEISEEKVEEMAYRLSQELVNNGKWYTDLKCYDYHYIIFPNKVFKVDRSYPKQYEETKEYGMSIGIPEHQLPNKYWAK